MTEPLNFVSLFAGIGGFDVGLERAGMRCVGQVEIDKYASAVLARHWPEVEKWNDVTTAVTDGWADELLRRHGHIDVVCGGFPCQPFSIAGKRLGRDDLRGNLFWNALAFTEAVKARYLIVENVPGLLTADNGNTFREILADLGDAGFDAEWITLDAQGWGVPQRRRRVFLVAYRAGAIDGPPILTLPESVRGDSGTVGATGAVDPRGAEGGAGGGGRGLLADTGVVQALTQGLGSGGPDAQHAQAGWLIPEDNGTPVALVDQEGFRMLGFGHYADDDTASALKARDWKDATDLVVTCEVTCVNCGDDIGPHHLCTDCLETLP